MDNGDGIAIRWLAHPIFRDKDKRLIEVSEISKIMEKAITAN